MFIEFRQHSIVVRFLLPYLIVELLDLSFKFSNIGSLYGQIKKKFKSY